nr:DNA cytosine methyltransferase [Oceanivirga sp.]
MKFNVLDIFSGAGGISCGLEQLNDFKTYLAVDFNKYALETFKKNHSNSEIILGDITDEKIKKEIIEKSKHFKINMIVGGPPCQGFSNKGKNLGLNDMRNYLFLEYIDLVEKIKPKIFIIENVKNMITCADGYFINQIQERFENLGYNISYKILNSYDFGIPQKRERTIIVGSLDFTFDFNDLYLEEYTKTNVYDAISDLSYHESGEGKFCENYKEKAITLYQKKLRNNSEYLYNHVATNHSKVALDKLKLIPSEKGKEYLPKKLHGRQKFNTTWSRLVWKEPSPTIDTRFDTPSNGKNSHPYLHRSITPREAARIQSFPDSYIFYGPKTEICKQIGNAVPPLLSKVIAKSIVRQSNFYTKK